MKNYENEAKPRLLSDTVLMPLSRSWRQQHQGRPKAPGNVAKWIRTSFNSSARSEIIKLQDPLAICILELSGLPPNRIATGPCEGKCLDAVGRTLQALAERPCSHLKGQTLRMSAWKDRVSLEPDTKWYKVRGVRGVNWKLSIYSDSPWSQMEALSVTCPSRENICDADTDMFSISMSRNWPKWCCL